MDLVWTAVLGALSAVLVLTVQSLDEDGARVPVFCPAVLNIAGRVFAHGRARTHPDATCLRVLRVLRAATICGTVTHLTVLLVRRYGSHGQRTERQ